MALVFICFAWILSFVCLGHGIRRGATKFELVVSLIFSVVYLVLGAFIMMGGKW